MFSQTLGRVQGPNFAAPTIVCNEDHRFLVAEELRAMETIAQSIILEPVARNTAPAIAVAAHQLAQRDRETLMLVLSSDQLVGDEEIFKETVMAAAELAKSNLLITFGIVPDRPETGYGYIRKGMEMGEVGFRVKEFVEKPDAASAETYLKSGLYYWNAGIFLFTAGAFLDELERFNPEISHSAKKALEKAETDLDFLRLNHEFYKTAPRISIDYGVMERTSNSVVVPLEAAWRDIGSWSSLWELGPADSNGNVTTGDTMVIDSKNNFLCSQTLLVAALGIENLIVVATDDVVLVIPKDRAQEVKDIVSNLETLDRPETINHTSVYRPWGYYQNLEEADGFLVKRIVVNPGAKLSLQYHKNRAEHWVVVKGAARVTNGTRTIDLYENQSTYIPVGTPHRLENAGPEPLHLIEVQSGDYIGEDDIVRLEDTYGRV
jgi:mannose-1-phosphate guanylyltransferase/mannose-6-phosphate isomerase